MKMRGYAHDQYDLKEIHHMTFESLKEIILATVNCGEEKVAPDAKLVPDDLMATFRTLNDLLAYLNEQGA